MSPTRELFGEEALHEAVANMGSLSLVDLRDRVMGRLDRHRAGAVLEDDLTLLMLRRNARVLNDILAAMRPKEGSGRNGRVGPCGLITRLHGMCDEQAAAISPGIAVLHTRGVVWRVWSGLLGLGRVR
jgi:hypothetical protein